MRSVALIGREAEFDAVTAFLDDLAPGLSGLVLVGEPGIGKTSILEAGLDAARRRGFKIVRCQPAEAERGLPFAALDALLREVLPRLESIPEPQGRAIRAAVGLQQSQDPPGRALVGAAVRTVLAELAESQPILVAIDDAHWLDAPTASALAYALRRVRDEAVRVLLTARPPGLPDVLAAALRHSVADSIEVVGLSVGALQRLLAQRLGQGLPRPTLKRAHSASRGNPFYALEIAKELVRTGADLRPGQPLRVPQDLTVLLAERVSRLSPSAQAVLSVVAAASSPTMALVERSLSSPGDAVREAAGAGILFVDGEAVRFTHPLLASVAYGRLLPSERRTLHRRLADRVEGDEERARHRALAASRPSAAIADALSAAAASALKRGAPESAAELEELAARLSPDDRPRRDRLISSARHRLMSGDEKGARTTCEELLIEPLTSEQSFDVLLLLAEARTDDFAVGLGFAEQASSIAGDRHRASLAAGMVADLRMATGDLRGSMAVATEMLRGAEADGDRYAVVSAIARVATIELFAGQRTPGLLERGIALEDPSLGCRTWDSPWFVETYRLMIDDDLNVARERFLAFLERGAAMGDEDIRCACVLHLTELECRAGDLRRAALYAQQSLECGEQSGLEYQGGSNLFPVALVDAYAGNVDECRRNAERGLALSERIGDEVFRSQNASVLGFLALSIGDHARADAILRPLADCLDRLGWAEPAKFLVLPNAIEALVGLGDLGEARRLSRRLHAQARATRGRWTRATARRSRGLILEAEGRLDLAIREFERALAIHEEMNNPFERARTLLVYGVALRRAKRKAPARAAIAGARDEFARIGASLWADRARREASRIGGRTASPFELTPSERSVAAAVAEGLSNRDVAERLCMSVRTVEGHLSSAYRKLGVRSRTELTVRLAANSPKPGSDAAVPARQP
jgi:DNA-binding CsgD family transcriptional regulator/tetratricopeptide (TPR) repeat protein